MSCWEVKIALELSAQIRAHAPRLVKINTQLYIMIPRATQTTIAGLAPLAVLSDAYHIAPYTDIYSRGN